MKTARSLPGELPPRALFPVEMPRYPNLWFLIDPSLALRGEYAYAVRLLVHALEEQLGLKDTFMEDVGNHALRHLLADPGEGSDFQARIGPLQPYRDPVDPGRDHRHQVHARFYLSPLIREGRTRQALPPGRGPQELFLVPASVHYEVATEEPLHPYADSCPLCGITGEYQVPVDPASQDYCLKIHDPLGLELLLHGTIRGQKVSLPNGTPVACLRDLRGPWSCRIEEHRRAEGEPLLLALVYLLAAGSC